MNVDRLVMAFAGTMVLVGLLLAHYVSPWWLLLPAFVGLNLLQSGFTGFCPPEKLLTRMGFKRGDGGSCTGATKKNLTCCWSSTVCRLPGV